MGDVVKNGICTMVGVIGSLIASQFGGWDAALSTLILFMAVDYITGLVVAGVFHASPKSKDSVADGETGIFFERQTAGSLTKALDTYEASTEQTWARDRLKRQAESFSEEIFRKKMIAFIANETLSIIENAGLMGVPIPKELTGAIEILKQKSEQDNMEE